MKRREKVKGTGSLVTSLQYTKLFKLNQFHTKGDAPVIHMTTPRSQNDAFNAKFVQTSPRECCTFNFNFQGVIGYHRWFCGHEHRSWVI